MVFDARPGYLPTLLKALRVHQWAKNMLIFVPLLASHRIFELPLLWNGLLAFVAFGACASSVYLLNDLLDLPDDRQHPTKRNRPLATGTLPILHALFLIPGLLVAAFALALWQLPWQFAAVLAAYYVLTLAYSLWLKRVVMLDVVTLAMLYTVRVIAGAAAMALVATFWILAYCMFLFLSLAFVKRYTDLRMILGRRARMTNQPAEVITRRTLNCWLRWAAPLGISRCSCLPCISTRRHRPRFTARRNGCGRLVRCCCSG